MCFCLASDAVCSMKLKSTVLDYEYCCSDITVNFIIYVVAVILLLIILIIFVQQAHQNFCEDRESGISQEPGRHHTCI